MQVCMCSRIFCYVFSATAETRTQVLLIDSLSVVYLLCCQGNCISCEGRDDAAEFASIRSAMKVLTYTDEEIGNLFKILAGLLHLGNTTFRGRYVYYDDNDKHDGGNNVQKKTDP